VLACTGYPPFGRDQTNLFSQVVAKRFDLLRRSHRKVGHFQTGVDSHRAALHEGSALWRLASTAQKGVLTAEALSRLMKVKCQGVRCPPQHGVHCPFVTTQPALYLTVMHGQLQ